MPLGPHARFVHGPANRITHVVLAGAYARRREIDTPADRRIWSADVVAAA
jgi:hypothetical protein